MKFKEIKILIKELREEIMEDLKYVMNSLLEKSYDLLVTFSSSEKRREIRNKALIALVVVFIFLAVAMIGNY